MKKSNKISFVVLGAFLCAVGLAGMIYYSIAMSKNIFVLFPPIYIAVLSIFALVLGAVCIFVVATDQKRKNAKKIVEMQNENVKKIQTQLGSVCPYCGTKVDSNSSFCKTCGENVTPIACIKCGQSNTSDSNYCKMCGEKLKKKLK